MAGISRTAADDQGVLSRSHSNRAKVVCVWLPTCDPIDRPSRLAEVAPNFFKVTDSAKLSKRKKQEKIQPVSPDFSMLRLDADVFL